jgi:hypothetical protein
MVIGTILLNDGTTADIEKYDGPDLDNLFYVGGSVDNEFYSLCSVEALGTITLL